MAVLSDKAGNRIGPGLGQAEWILRLRPEGPANRAGRDAWSASYARRGRWETYAAGSRSGSTANCRAALPPIMRAINGSGTSASRSWVTASQALVAS